MTGNDELPEEAKRIRSFASFFKNYMGVSALVTAALPIPVTVLEAIPVYASQKATLAVYASLLCFLLLAYLFYIRHAIGAVLFTKRSENPNLARILDLFPLLLIIATVGCIYGYHALLADTTRSIKGGEAFAINLSSWPADIDKKNFEAMNSTLEDGRQYFGPTQVYILKKQGSDEIPNGTALMTIYLALFLCAEGAFVLMALREYLQDVLKLNDVSLLYGSAMA